MTDEKGGFGIKIEKDRMHEMFARAYWEKEGDA